MKTLVRLFGLFAVCLALHGTLTTLASRAPDHLSRVGVVKHGGDEVLRAKDFEDRISKRDGLAAKDMEDKISKGDGLGVNAL